MYEQKKYLYEREIAVEHVGSEEYDSRDCEPVPEADPHRSSYQSALLYHVTGRLHANIKTNITILNNSSGNKTFLVSPSQAEQFIRNSTCP